MSNTNIYKNPSSELVNQVDDNMVEVTWSIATRVWWSYVWRFMLISLLGGAIIGAIGGLIVGILGKPELGGIIGVVLGYLITLPISIYLFKKILNKDYKHYKIRVLTKNL
ncbi:hypothetical protein [Zooshikella sp. RANM57]|uniref:hypothetical protein n=1 Tax=Zooshikella sp. RANM57 TaxID=3425863 RepID=UPI003D6E0CAE